MNLKILAAVIAMAAILSAEAKVSVSNVVCQQQYPWNGKVDIDYELFGDAEDTNVWICITSIDKAANRLMSMRTLIGDGINAPTKPGKHHIVWDSAKDHPNLKSDAASVMITAISGLHMYMIIDLSAGPDAESYPISYLSKEPEGGWPEEYKTTNLVMRLILPGTFTMGSPVDELERYDNETQHVVTLTKPFYIGVFEVTQKQYELIMGSNPSCYLGDARPVEQVSYNMIRGADKGSNWPSNDGVDETSFFGKLRTKTSKTFDLPAEAQWEYACRAGTVTALNSGKNLSYQCREMAEVGRYDSNLNDGKGGYCEHTKVGSYLPNAWGLYDMHGNVWEWCLDWGQEDLGSTAVDDPKGPLGGRFRVLRGGSWCHYADRCRSAYRYDHFPYYVLKTGCGFRIALVL